jgi:5-methylcytosine-specific restriction enzyme A
MTAVPCLTCGEPCAGPRCPQHTTDPKPGARARGYGAQWDRLSKRARRMQPWCSTCGATEGLQADHSVMAWHRVAMGLPVRLEDVDVLCGPWNRARGAARGHAVTRGDAPNGDRQDPPPRQYLRYTPPGGIS